MKNKSGTDAELHCPLTTTGPDRFLLPFSPEYHTQLTLACLEGMLHNLGNTCTAMSCAIENALPYLPPAQRQQLLAAHSACRSYLHHSTQFLRRPTSNPVHLKETICCVQNSLSRTRALLTPLAVQHHTHLYFRFPKHPCARIAGDAAVLDQVLTNVMLNSLEHVSQTQPPVTRWIRVSMHRSQHSLILKITNPYTAPPLDARRETTSHFSALPHGMGLAYSRFHTERILHGQLQVLHTKKLWQTTLRFTALESESTRRK